MTRRARIEALVEQLIGLLDDMDGDPDLEPYLAGLHMGDHTDDREGDDSDDEPGTWIEQQTCREYETVACEDLEEQHDREWDAAEHGIADADAMNSEEFCFSVLGFDGSGRQRATALLHLHDAHRYSSGADMPTTYTVSAAR